MPDLQAFRIIKLYQIETNPRYQKYLNPKLLFKVLRGSRLTCFADSTGHLLTTQKVINFFPQRDLLPYLEGLQL